MGYRSDVHYAIKFETKQNMDAFIGMCLLDPNKAEALSECKVEKDSLLIIYQITDAKWYSNYEIVQHHEELYNFAAGMCDTATPDGEMPISLCCAFTRIGEDTGDIEELSSGDWGWELLSVRRYTEGEVFDVIDNAGSFAEYHQSLVENKNEDVSVP